MNKINQQNNNFTYGLYARKSSESEDKQMQSIDRQIDDLVEIAKRDSIVVYGEPITESQSAFSLGREGFNRLVQLTQDGEINAWFCWHLNRLSRNPVDAGTIIYLMDLGLLHHIKTPSRTFFNTPTDKMMLQIELTMSKKDSDDKSSFVKSGLKKRYKKGLPNGKAPIGFMNDKTKEKGDRDWFVDELRMKKVKSVFKRFIRGQDSVSSITGYAREELCLTTPETKRTGGNLVSRSYVHHMLTNSIFAGFFYSKDEDGNGTTRRELQRSVPRVITEDEHNRIISILGGKNTSRTQCHERPYTGSVWSPEGNFIGVNVIEQVICDCKHKFAHRNKDKCPKCDIEIPKMKSPNYLHYVHYYNVKRKQSKGVKYKSIREEKINEFLRQYAQENLNISPELTEWAKKHLHELKDAELEENRTVFKAQSHVKEKTEKQKKKLREMYTREMITEEEYRSDLAGLQQVSKTVETPYVKNWFEKLEDIIDLGVEFQNIIENGTIKEKKEVLSRLGSNLIWDEENLSISNEKWMDAYINGRKRVLSKYPMFEPKNNVGNKQQKTPFGVPCPVVLPGQDSNLRPLD